MFDWITNSKWMICSYLDIHWNFGVPFFKAFDLIGPKIKKNQVKDMQTKAN